MNLPRLVASGFGSGLAPIAPGTMGSFVALLLGAAMLAWWPPALPIAALFAYFGGLWAVKATDTEDDPGWVVIDEFCGQWIAMLALPGATVAGCAAAFVLFRAFDIVKPGPVRTAERLGGPQGVMADDVVAGAISAGLILLIRSGWPDLLGGP